MDKQRALEFAYEALLQNAAKYQSLLDLKSGWASERVLKEWVSVYMEAAEEIGKMLPGTTKMIYSYLVGDEDDEEADE